MTLCLLVFSKCFIQSLTHALTHLFTTWLEIWWTKMWRNKQILIVKLAITLLRQICQMFYPLNLLLTCQLTHLLTHSLTHSLTHLLTHSPALTHPLTHHISLMQWFVSMVVLVQTSMAVSCAPAHLITPDSFVNSLTVAVLLGLSAWLWKEKECVLLYQEMVLLPSLHLM